MSIVFRQETRSSSFLDPFDGFREKRREVQIREDPLTGAVSRVFAYRRRPPQQSETADEDQPPVCAFCKENIETMTSKFPPALIPQGRLRRGEAVVFPNIFPYDTHNAVVVITEQHEVAITGWSARKLVDALAVSREYIETVVGAEGDRWIYSINWNYTPIAGASQLHPHLQIVLSRQPTREQGRLIEAGRKYMETNAGNYWEDLIRAEEEADVRYGGHTGDIPWLVSYAPRGFVPDVIAILPDDTDFTTCRGEEIEQLAGGLVKLFNYYGSRRVTGANLTLYSQSPGEDYFWTHARIVPRLRIPPLNISDVNYFKLMHDEGITLFTPERMCEELKPFFQES